MKRDITIAAAAVLVVAAITFALASFRSPVAPSRSEPRSTAGTSEKATPEGTGKAVMQINGEAVTDTEFAAFLRSAPEDARQFYANPAGRRALADEIIKLKLLEQEAERLGMDKDPEIAERMEMIRAQMLAAKALEQLVRERVDKELRATYEKEKGSALGLHHIVIAYEGGAIPPKGQGRPLSPDQAMAKAQEVASRLRAGADFGAMANAESDDQQSAAQGGSLGPVQPDGLPPEVRTVVTKLKPGEISAPVRTQFGVHVFKVEPASFEDMKPVLSQRLQQKAMADTLADLQKRAKIDLDEKFFPQTPGIDTPKSQGQPPQPKQPV